MGKEEIAQLRKSAPIEGASCARTVKRPLLKSPGEPDDTWIKKWEMAGLLLGIKTATTNIIRIYGKNGRQAEEILGSVRHELEVEHHLPLQPVTVTSVEQDNAKPKTQRSKDGRLIAPQSDFVTTTSTSERIPISLPWNSVRDNALKSSGHGNIGKGLATFILDSEDAPQPLGRDKTYLESQREELILFIKKRLESFGARPEKTR